MTQAVKLAVLIGLGAMATMIVGGCGDAKTKPAVSKSQYTKQVNALLAREKVITAPITAAEQGMDESTDATALVARCAQIRSAGVRARPQVKVLSTEMAALVPPKKVWRLHNRLAAQYRMQEWDRGVSTLATFCAALGTQDDKTIDNAAWALEQYNEQNAKQATALEASFKHEGYSLDLTDDE